MSPGIHGPMNLLSSTILGPWNKFDDVATWRYCASEMLSYISLYATYGTSPIAAITSQVSTDLDPVLRRAVGVCAAHGTLTQTQKHVFDQLLGHELEQLATLSQSAPVYDARWQRLHSETILRETTARLQALIMYQIIRLFSDRAQDFRKAAAYEALLASWAREMQLQVHILQQYTQSTGNTTIVGFGFEEADPNVLDAAHRAILMSYTVRAVHSVLNYKTCAVWDDLFTITMPTSLSGPIILLYPEYINAWEIGATPTLNEDNRRLSNLIVAACKGVDAVEMGTT
ncbi:C6 finger domain-containing protein [Colletotrichum graminicola]|nr:C6 finger domain-containing protein [Colletotrichum graminicola]